MVTDLTYLPDLTIDEKLDSECNPQFTPKWSPNVYLHAAISQTANPCRHKSCGLRFCYLKSHQTTPPYPLFGPSHGELFVDFRFITGFPN